ncbi:hypothetical protein MMC25_005441 [Agyrium rufum]|nr:hypothetical protein [Agyrium rufum]
MPSASTSGPSEADLIFTRASLALAKSQRLISSWLPPSAIEGSHSPASKTEAQIEREEEEAFKPMPERLGLGATPVDESNDGVRRELNKDDELRKRLFGNKEFAGMFGKGKVKGANPKTSLMGVNGSSQGVGTGSKPRPVEKREEKANRSEDEEDVGRSALGKSRKRRAVVSTEGAGDPEDRDPTAIAVIELGSDTLKARSTRKMTYMDELLQERERKKNKKNKRQSEPNEI